MLNPKDLAIVDSAVKETFQELKRYHPDDFAKLENNSSKMASIMNAVKDVATEHVMLSKEFAEEPSNIEERLAKYFPESRIKLIKGGLAIPTFRMDITKKDDGNHWVDITRDNKPLYEPKMLTTIDNIEWSIIMQMASLEVECVLLCLQAIGISVSPDGHAVEEGVEQAATTIKHSNQFQRAIRTFIDTWNKAGAGGLKRARAIFVLIKDTYAAGILWTIIKTICQNMAWYEWLLTITKVTVMIIAALATDGVALIAKIALMLWSATDIGIKVANLNQLEAIKETL